MPSIPATDLDSRRRGQAKLRVQVFEEQYGPLALKLACYAAFPLAITADLLYCLRENFVPECPWYMVGDILLSGLCDAIGYDLYRMEGETRFVLLSHLKQNYGKEKPPFYDLQNFMVTYLEYRLQAEGVENRNQLRMISEPADWTALAFLNPLAAVEAIEQKLQQIADREDGEQRFEMAALLEDYGDLLSEHGLRPIFLKDAQKVAQGEPIESLTAAVETALAATQTAGFPPLQTLTFETVEVYFVDETEELELEPVGLHPFSFQTVKVNPQGEIVSSETLAAQFFAEPLPNQAFALEMVAIPGGEYWMGSPENEVPFSPYERPQHHVTVPPFFMGRYPITQAQWRAVAGLPQINHPLEPAPAHFKGNSLPIEQVSLQDAEEFCARLSIFTGREYRLPTEAEWEYACRAGTTTLFHFGDTITTDVANYNGDYNDGLGPKGEYRATTTPVGSFPANAFGLQDMHGNVWEWCLDHWHNNYEGAPEDGSAWLVPFKTKERLFRGGAWCDDDWLCRSACCPPGRNPHDRYYYIGFRVVCGGTP
jgi:formylglycine-generating enzyme required for sulfatase activity